jgi:hypothetical protein
VTDYQSQEKTAASREATEGVGNRDPRGVRGGEVGAALMRYLAAEQYHEKVEEDRELESGGSEPPG